MKRKLEAAVAGFAYQASFILVSNTPIGDNTLIATNFNYARYYEIRQENYGIEMEAGFHRGAWEYTESSASFSMQVNDYRFVPDDVQSSAGASYNLGDKFYIAASGPAFEEFEQGKNRQAPNGILQPSVAQIMNISSITMQGYFDNG